MLIITVRAEPCDEISESVLQAWHIVLATGRKVTLIFNDIEVEVSLHKPVHVAVAEYFSKLSEKSRGA